MDTNCFRSFYLAVALCLIFSDFNLHVNSTSPIMGIAPSKDF